MRWYLVALAALTHPPTARAPHPSLAATTTPPPPKGHVFVLHGDLTRLLADARLYPTTDPDDEAWFPSSRAAESAASSGIAAHAAEPPAASPLPPFTPRMRVHQLPQTPPGSPLVFLANVDGRQAPPRDCEPSTGRPSLDWFLAAARQYLEQAAASVTEGPRVRGRRAQPLLALPVVGTGNGGARTDSGRMISRLLEVLYEFTATRAIDVALVVKGERRFSAAQALRRQMAPPWEATLGTRLSSVALELAQRAKANELALFIGAGVSVGAGLPAWQELLTSLAERDDVPLEPQEVQQLRRLDLPDQASVLCSRLGTAELGSDDAAVAASPSPFGSPALSTGASAPTMKAGEAALQRLVVEELSADLYSVAHGLLAGLPIEAVVTTNYDELFEEAWRGAASDFKVLPYEADARARFVLKLHGDLRRPQDIVLTRAQMSGAREQRAALAGVVQAMLMTKHLCFVGFSLQDPNFSEVAETVRATITGDSGTASRNLFGSLLSLHNRPFLAELWPDLQQVPMDIADASGPHCLSSAQCARRLDIFLDKMSLDASTPTRHLLDPDFSGVFDSEQSELREVLLLFEAELAKRPAARAASGFEAVSAMLQGLGLPDNSPALADDRYRERDGPGSASTD